MDSARIAVRKRLDSELLTDDDFEAFCIDCFPDAKRQFSSGMNRTQKTNILIERIEAAVIDGALSKWEVARKEPSSVGSPDFSRVEQAVRNVARDLLKGWQNSYRFDQEHFVELSLREHKSRRNNESPEGETEAPAEGDATPSDAWTLPRIVETLSEGHSFVLLGQPGAGKTVTLLQIAQRLLEQDGAPIPLLFHVSDWVDSKVDLTDFVDHRLIKARVSPEERDAFLKSGRLALLLNGWNETSATNEEKEKANRHLREFVQSGAKKSLVITSRETQIPPLVPTLINVLPLSSSSKAEVVNHAGLADPGRFLAQLDNDPALAEMTDTPLFLSLALREARAGRAIPSTRSAFFETFIDGLALLQ